MRQRLRLMVGMPWIAAPRKALVVSMLQLGNGLAVVLAVQLGGTALLLARVAPVLLFLPLFAIPSVIAAPITQWISSRLQERAQRYRRLEGNLTWMFSQPRSAPEIRMFGLQEELL